MTVLTASVYGAPPVFVWQPFVLTNGAQLETLQNGAGLVVTLDGKYVFLVDSGSSLESHEEEVAEEQYDENYEKSEDWKEQQEAEEQRQKELEENGDYESGDYTVATKYEGKEEEITTENRVLEESDDYVQEREDESENHEKPQKDKNDSECGSGEEEVGKGNSTEKFYDEKTESPNESEIVKEKSTSGEGNAEMSETESDYDKSKSLEKKRESTAPEFLILNEKDKM
jgi:hypothetical protein